MLLNVQSIKVKRVSDKYHGGKWYMRSVAKLLCDGCGREFERALSTSRGDKHFCTRKCAAVGLSSARVRTSILKYGVACPMNQPHIKERANSPEACAKRNETKKRNGSYRKSNPEDLLYEFMCSRFGAVDVVRQVRIPGKRWEIDFYVPSIDVFVQEDGAYWHGLDRPIEVIAEHRTKQDVQIHKKWLTDRAQDAWFEAAGKCLVRITDIEVHAMGDRVLDKLMTCKAVADLDR